MSRYTTAVLRLDQPPGGDPILPAQLFVEKQMLQLSRQARAVAPGEERNCFAVCGDLPMYREITEEAWKAETHCFERHQGQSFRTQRWIDKNRRIFVKELRLALEAGEANVQSVGSRLKLRAIAPVPDDEQ